jgi:uncharacterized protein
LPQIVLTYLDTNVFIKAFEPSKQVESEVSNALIAFLGIDARPAKQVHKTSEFTFSELWVGACKKGNQELVDLYTGMSASNGFMEVGPVTLEVLKGAALLRLDYSALKMPDAIHLATAILFKCRYFMTGDTRINGSYTITTRYNGFTRPFGSVEIVRPNLVDLKRISDQIRSPHD